MKVIAMYLPQFHRVKENDEWWGEGFTEWTTVQGADKLFAEHYQPRVPLNQNYYNLLEKDTLLWQAALMKKYSVDGICMYHYWFKNGRQILEKPAEKLLGWTDIDMPYCFCWANETWARSWSRFRSKNVWADVYEQKENTESNGILLEQGYGNESHWKKHFEYLLPFFQDKRYIRLEDKPLFLIYKATEIPCLQEMLEYWQELACDYGLKGLYIIGNTNANIKGMEAKICYEPVWSRKHLADEQIHRNNGVCQVEYDDIWNAILSENVLVKRYFEGLVGYDDTPRRGCKGMVILHATPEKFAHYLTELMAKSAACGNEICFLNAWNEWGEGMYLEPDEKYEEQYLEAIPRAKRDYVEKIKKYKNKGNTEEKVGIISREGKNRQVEKNVYYLQLMDQWMELRENDVSIADKLVHAQYTKVAIYGYGIMGRHLLWELQQSQVSVEYLIDLQKDNLHTDVKVYLPSDELPEVDAVIVCAAYYYNEVYQCLKEKGISKIISIETVICEDVL